MSRDGLQARCLRENVRETGEEVHDLGGRRLKRTGGPVPDGGVPQEKGLGEEVICSRGCGLGDKWVGLWMVNSTENSSSGCKSSILLVDVLQLGPTDLKTSAGNHSGEARNSMVGGLQYSWVREQEVADKRG